MQNGALQPPPAAPNSGCGPVAVMVVVAVAAGLAVAGVGAAALLWVARPSSAPSVLPRVVAPAGPVVAAPEPPPPEPPPPAPPPPALEGAPLGADSDPQAPGDLPATPSRTDVLAAMRVLDPDVQACGDGSHGMVIVRVTFSSSGRASAVTVETSLSPPVSSCVARVVRGAIVPPFQQPAFTVNYPFRV